ncbi:hypothetical protein IVB18_41985 [Bradyrhizobium sp. 186]|uniref:hypothetical protein n=1 Tax=Bradyrhizobium sp. 186 TaxID=2782654 RepID=UPI00200088E9|nr:hypothetical protein [Bradyrhizobium sp. 186]UPK34551.1 hypothetical protein IVB18_41985 [Bradyrhizobium sp. 186]
MAHKIIASQFTYASRAIATPERHCPTQCALAHAFAKVIDQASIAVHARTHRDAPATCRVFFALKMRQKVDALAEALIKPRISGRVVAKPQA